MVKSSKVIRPRVQVDFSDDPGMTQQHFKDEANVNHIMAKYGASRLLEHYSQFQGNYGDFTEVQDYQTSLNEVIKAQDMFMSLPSEVRTRFGNDPAQFLDFVGREENRSEMKKLGLLREDVVVQPMVDNVPNSIEKAPE